MSITAETRREAYEQVAPKISAMETKVLAALRAYGPQTAEEIMRRLGTNNPNNVRPRLTGLKKKGLALDIRKRKDADGHTAAVWEAVESLHKKAAPGGSNTGDGSLGNDLTVTIPQGV